MVHKGDQTYGEITEINFGNQNGGAAAGTITIGKYCSIAQEVVGLLNGNHEFFVTTFPYFMVKPPLPPRGLLGLGCCPVGAAR